MDRTKIWLVVGMLLVSAGFCEAADDIFTEDSIEVGLGVTNVYQQNVRGGISKHNKAGRISGSYDIELGADLQKLLGIEDAGLFVHMEGSWPRTDYDTASVGSVFGINGDYAGRHSVNVTELWYEQYIFGDDLLLRIGKMDITGGFQCGGCPVAFDSSSFANDETSQFLNSALVNNPTIPFPDYALGVAVFYSPVDKWYAAASIVDAQNDFRETGFNTAFHDEDYFFYIFETGVTPQFNSDNGSLQGAYRVGFWYDPQPKANSDGGKNYRDDLGLYVSCDQMLARENTDPQDSQGLGAFFRFGYADGKRNDIANFWSAGLQYQGLFDGRDDDVLGLGFAYGVFSNSASTTYTDDYENAFELYYSVPLTPQLNISPSVQYIANPGGDKTKSDSVVLGVRAQINF